MKRLGLIACALSLCVAGLAHANQVDEVPPPPPPATSSTPGEVPAPTPVPVLQPAPEVPPPPPPPAAQAGTSAHWESSASTSTTSSSDPGVRTHDGFFFRGALGFGGGYWSEDIGSSSSSFSGNFELTGVSVGFDLAVGMMVTENLALHVSLFGSGISDPEVTVDGESLGKAEDTSLTGGGFGVGLTYYVMPLNLYFSGALGLGSAVLTIDQGTADERSADTDTGFAISLMVGKEWWVSSQWGLGVAVQLVHIDVPDLDTRLSGTGLQLMFSATYN